MAFTRFRIATQLLVLVTGTALLMIILLVITAIVQGRTLLQQQATDQGTAVTVATGELLAASLSAHDAPGIQRIVMSLVQHDTIDRVSVFDPTGALIIAQTSPDTMSAADPNEDADFARATLHADGLVSRTEEDHVDIAVPIRLNGQLLGVVVGQSDLEQAADVVDATIPQQLAVGVGVSLLAALLAIVIARYIALPIRELATAATAIGQGDGRAPPTTNRGGEVGDLTRAFGQMVVDLRRAQAAIAAQHQMLETQVAERTADLTQTLAELRATVTARDQLHATIRDLSSPVVPILDGILVMPLIGVIDSARAGVLMHTLLSAIEQHRARRVIIDVTGVPLIDTHVARVLLQVADAARLLGTETILVGLRPELAQTIVGLALDLTRLRTRADLQSAVRDALHDARATR